MSVMWLKPLIVALVLRSCLGLDLVVLHTNDLHSRFSEITSRGSQCPDSGNNDDQGQKRKCYGGVARIKAVADDIKRDNPGRVIFVNGGDFFQGTVWYSMFKWRIVANLTRPMGYTATSLGNHEFDDGVQDLVDFIDATNDAYPSLACNLDLTNEPELKKRMKGSMVVTMADGVKVGIIGYVTPDTKGLASTGDVIFLDEVDAINREIEFLKGQGVQIFVALGHSGYAKDKEIAEKVPEVDIVVGGHTNTFLWNKGEKLKNGKNGDPSGSYPTVIEQPKSGRKVLVVQTSGYGKYLGFLKVTFDENGEMIHFSGNPILLDSSKPVDQDLQRMVDAYGKEVKSKMDVVIGHSDVFIDGGRPKCRLEECAFGNLVTDAMASEMDADIAVINSGAIKGSFDKGEIKMEDVFTAMPWSNTVDVVTIPGSALIDMLEHSVSEYDPMHEDPGGRFLQLSGLVVTFNIRNEPGNRVVSAYIAKPGAGPDDREPIVDDRNYDVAILSFMVKGGDGYQMIPDNLITHKNTGFLDNDVLLAYLKKHEPLQLPKSGRIHFANADPVRFATASTATISTKLRMMILLCPVAATAYRTYYNGD